MKYICVIPVHNETPEAFTEAFFSMYFQCKRLNVPIVVVLDNVKNLELYSVAYRLSEGKFCTMQEFEFGNLSKVLNFYLFNGDFDYMIRMDGDDIAHPDRLKKQMDYLERYNHQIDVLGTEMFPFWDYPFDQSQQAFNKLHGEIPEPNSNDYWIINHPTAILKRRSVVLAGGYDETVGLHDGQDTLLWERMYKAGYVIRNVPEVLLKYRRPLKLKGQ